MRDHVIFFHLKLKFKCQQCPDTFERGGNLAQHADNRHGQNSQRIRDSIPILESANQMYQEFLASGHYDDIWTVESHKKWFQVNFSILRFFTNFFFQACCFIIFA